MKSRWDASRWLLLGCGVILAVVLIDVSGWLATDPDYVPPPRATSPRQIPAGTNFLPDFRVGDRAPDFTLPDSKGQPHRLSELATNDTMLCFICGCNNCRDLQTYMGQLISRIHENAPTVVSVATMPKEGNDAWIRDTVLRQTILYEKKEGPIMTQYKGHPCPRVYRLKPGMRVQWIGPSTKDTPYLEAIGRAVAANLGNPTPEGHRLPEDVRR